MTVRIQTEDFDLGAETLVLREANRAVGALACFVGTVRDINDGSSVSAMVLEHYAGMTEKSIESIIDQARERWKLIDALVIHRVGELKPTDQIVLVAVTSSHRTEAFAACEFIMDYLKTSAPFWKKESTPSGERWVDAREADDAALARWGVRSTNAQSPTD
ncbi:molybdopterin synthase catalytic subunit MoaE [Pararobbsia alpina]|uniref:Molybdopterin synthase catalytic subunit n=1 Tax=Pararobbsia alpina TaxID=621374 RepID=A0A6S7BDH2_9BURK|nr:molybdopterin synthase catalytic subunit MoaE [Pararobbsia alpina]CAB3796583.1 Molybdopterin synthase catalytic subunit [Pararobbsia alpina]